MLSATFPYRRKIMGGLLFQEVAGSNQDHRTWLGKVSLANLDARPKQNRIGPPSFKNRCCRGKKFNKIKVTYHRFWMVSYHRQGWDERAMNADLETKQQTFEIPVRRSREILQMRSRRLVRGPDCQGQSRNSHGFGPSIHWHSGIWGTADEKVWNKIHKKII